MQKLPKSDMTVVVLSVHPLRFGVLSMTPDLVECADGSVHNEDIDDVLLSRVSSF